MLQAEQEEIWMGEKHPGYKEYAADVPRFIPTDTEKVHGIYRT
jgi:protein-S-isoprenylcysteine O-methyltransferase Ste14